MARAADQAEAAGLTGILVAPGPDLVYLAGYMPVAITERLTLLVVQKHRDPAMILPVLERPDAERAPSAGTIALTDWTDGERPVRGRRAAARAGRDGTRSPTRPGRCSCSACRRRCPGRATCR